MVAAVYFIAALIQRTVKQYIVIQVLTEKQDAFGLLFYLLILIITICIHFLIVKILDVYILGIGLLYFIMAINFVSVILPVVLVYQKIAINIMSLNKMVSWPQYFPTGKKLSDAFKEKYVLFLFLTGFLICGVSMGYEE